MLSGIWRTGGVSCRVGRLDADSGGTSLDISYCAAFAYRTSGFRIGLCTRDTGRKCMCRRRILSRSNLGTRGRGPCSDDYEAALCSMCYRKTRLCMLSTRGCLGSVLAAKHHRVQRNVCIRVALPEVSCYADARGSSGHCSCS